MSRWNRNTLSARRQSDVISTSASDDTHSFSGHSLQISSKESKANGGSNIELMVSVLLIPITVGCYVYSFGLYANELKENLNLSQSELTTLSSAIFCAGVLQWVPGIIVDKYGERFSMLVGAFLGSSGMVLYWFIAKTYITIEPRWMLVPGLTALTVLIYLSECLIYGSVFKIIVKVCHDTKGTIVGVAKGQVGLGAGVFVMLFSCFPTKSHLDILLLMAAFFVVFNSCLPFFGGIPSTIHGGRPDPFTKHHLYLIYLSMFLCALLVVGQSLWGLYTGIGDADNDAVDEPQEQRELDEAAEGGHIDYLKFLIVLAAWTGPLVSMLFLKRSEHSRLPLSEPSSNGTMSKDKELRASYNLIQMLQTPAAWLLAWTLIMLAGAGVSVTQSVGQMVQALEFPKSTTPAALALFAVGNATSRVVTGAVSEGFVQSGIPRPALLLVAAFASTVAHALLAMADDEFEFLISLALAGIAFGMYHPLLILIVGELFGPKYLASNFLFFDGLSLAGGSLVVNKFISQHVYEAHLEEGQKTCIGRGCFGTTHWITCGLCMSSFVACSCLLATKLARQAYSNQLPVDKE